MTEKYRVIANGTIIHRKSEPTAGTSSSRAKDLMAFFRAASGKPGTARPAAWDARRQSRVRRSLQAAALLQLALGRDLRGLKRCVDRLLARECRAHLLAHGHADRLELGDRRELHADVRALGQRR